MNREPKKFLNELFDAIEFTPDQRRDAMSKFEKDLDIPAKLIGIGQCGVGKTELLRSIFRISDDNLSVLKTLRTGGTEETTKSFNSFTIRTESGFRVQFTDGPGLGADEDSDERYISEWMEEIPKHDLLYWVLDAASRDISHIQRNMRLILDQTGFRDRFVLILNKVDNIQLEEVDREAGDRGWVERFNQPSKKLLHQIQRRTEDIITKFVTKVDIPRDNIIGCSALRRWQHDLVLDRMIDLLPAEKRIKVSENRDVKSAVDLMDEDVRRRIESDDEKKGS